MKTKFKKGYTIYNGAVKEPFIVTPHSGPALDVVTSRDDHSETVASLAWKKMGGTLFVSNTPRERLWGVDFNRDIPSLKEALSNFDNFVSKTNVDKKHEYVKKYGWVARDERDYEERLRMYQNFWGDISKGDFILLIHKAFPKMKFVPSVMDITTFSGEKIKNKLRKEISEHLNSKYYYFLEKIRNDYNNSIMYESKRTILNILRSYGTINLEKIGPAFKGSLEKDLKKIYLYADIIAKRRLTNNFTPHNFLEAVKNSLERVDVPQITFENTFKGDLSFGPKRKLHPLKNKIVIQIEGSGFLNFWHPDIAAEMIKDIYDMLKNDLVG
tara:strand:+ start:63729 stop:64709 length:981 start_codon:yes stop_codon:yes gene_type:complete